MYLLIMLSLYVGLFLCTLYYFKKINTLKRKFRLKARARLKCASLARKNGKKDAKKSIN